MGLAIIGPQHTIRSLVHALIEFHFKCEEALSANYVSFGEETIGHEPSASCYDDRTDMLSFFEFLIAWLLRYCSGTMSAGIGLFLTKNVMGKLEAGMRFII